MAVCDVPPRSLLHRVLLIGLAEPSWLWYRLRQRCGHVIFWARHIVFRHVPPRFGLHPFVVIDLVEASSSPLWIRRRGRLDDFLVCLDRLVGTCCRFLFPMFWKHILVPAHVLVVRAEPIHLPDKVKHGRRLSRVVVVRFWAVVGSSMLEIVLLEGRAARAPQDAGVVELPGAERVCVLLPSEAELPVTVADALDHVVDLAYGATEVGAGHEGLSVHDAADAAAVGDLEGCTFTGVPSICFINGTHFVQGVDAFNASLLAAIKTAEVFQQPMREPAVSLHDTLPWEASFTEILGVETGVVGAESVA